MLGSARLRPTRRPAKQARRNEPSLSLYLTLFLPLYTCLVASRVYVCTYEAGTPSKKVRTIGRFATSLFPSTASTASTECMAMDGNPRLRVPWRTGTTGPIRVTRSGQSVPRAPVLARCQERERERKRESAACPCVFANVYGREGESLSRLASREVVYRPYPPHHQLSQLCWCRCIYCWCMRDHTLAPSRRVASPRVGCRAAPPPSPPARVCGVCAMRCDAM